MKIDAYLTQKNLEMYNELFVNFRELTPSNPSISVFLICSLFRLQSGVNLIHRKDAKLPVLQFMPTVQYYLFNSAFSSIRFTSQNINYNKRTDNYRQVNEYIINLAPGATTFLRFHLKCNEVRETFNRSNYLKVLLAQNSKIQPKKIGEMLKEKYSGLKDIFSMDVYKFSRLINGNPSVRYPLDDLTLKSQEMIVNEANFMLNTLQK